MYGMPGSNMPQMAQVIEAPPIVTKQEVSGGVTNAAVRNARPVSQQKKGLFRLTGLKYLFD
jgi:hypothetical protein